MKYITVALPGFLPTAILFSPHASHEEIAKLIGLPILSAGFVKIEGTKAETTGFSTSLECGPHSTDKDLIEHGLTLTARQFPKPARPIAVGMFAAARNPIPPTFKP